MKKNKIDVIDGFGKIKPGKKVDVTAADGKVTEYSADHIIIATGARSRELPNLPQDGIKVIGYRQAMTLPKQVNLWGGVFDRVKRVLFEMILVVF